jgi:S1-C subfamily serine protease
MPPAFFQKFPVAAALLLAHGLAAIQPARADTTLPALVRTSLVRVSTTAVMPDYRMPWIAGRSGGGVGAGFVIAGNRVMTNAHVVSNARFLALEKDGDPNRWLADVKFIAHDADLAVLELRDPRFFTGMTPLEFGGIPALDSTVSVYGYPIGGERLSITRGVVSRVDFQLYSHSGADSHLAIQIDAAINPGNSGGPVLQDGKVVGVAFQGYSGDVAQNTGYMIPTPVVRRFLKDIEDGSYDRYVDLAIGYFSLLNPAQRRALGLKDDGHGVLVTRVYAKGSCEGVLEKGDVLLEIDGHQVASDGFVELDGERVEMPEIVERKFLGDPVTFRILRAGAERQVTATLKSASAFMINARNYDVAPRYVTLAGLLFQPLDREFIETWRPEDLRLRYTFDAFASDEIYVERPEVVVLSAVLPDPVNTYLSGFAGGIVDTINDRKIRGLADVAAAVDAKPEHYVIRLLGEGRPLVLERAAAEEAAGRIRSRYQIPSDRNLEAAR